MNMRAVIKGVCALAVLGLSTQISAQTEYTPSAEVPDIMSSWIPSGFTGNAVHPLYGQAPASWNDAVAAGHTAYYIDSSAANATNTNNPQGTPELPRASIPEITYPAGAYIEIHGGPYDGGGQIIFTGEGTADKPVWFRGPSKTSPANITGEVIVKGQYVFLENLAFTVPKKMLSMRSHNSSTLHHAVIRHSTFSGGGDVVGSGSAIAIYGASGNRFHDFVVYDNEISYSGDSYDDVDPSAGLSMENDFHGILPRMNLDRVWILKNNIHHMGGDSVQVGVASIPDDTRPTQIYIADNEFYSNLENGVDVKEADYVLAVGNKIYNWVEHLNNSSTGTAVVVHNGATNVWLVNNDISKASRGVSVTGASLNTWVVGNIIYDIRHPSWYGSWGAGLYESGAAIHFRSGSSGGAVNNTVVNYDKGLEATTGTYQFINNILTERNESSGYDIFAESSTNQVNAQNNLIYHSRFAPSYNNVSCVNCINESPQLDASFKSADGFPGSGQGYSIDAQVQEFKNSFSADLGMDIFGNPRVTAGIDIGAYENPGNVDAPQVIDKPQPPTIQEVKEQQQP